MRAASGFHWTRVDNHIPQAQDAIRDALADVVTKAVLDIQGDAISQAPVVTGRLKTSIQAVTPTSDWEQVIAGGVGTNVEYAAYVELGTGQAGAGSAYPYPRQARYTMSWAGMTARAMIGNAAKRVEPSFLAVLARLQDRLPGKV